MNKSAAVISTIILLFAVTAESFAEIKIRKGGSTWAEISSGGTVRIKGKVVGEISSNGTVRKSGSIAGEIEARGIIRKKGAIVGEIQTDGRFRKSGSIIAEIEKNGNIRKKGAIWGTASSCCGNFADVRTVAAVLAFFTDDFGF